MISRRTLLRTGLAAVAPLSLPLQAGDFWKDKAPADWTDQETAKLLNKSPWAKEATVNTGSFEGMGRGGGGRGGRGGGDMGGGRGGMGGGGMGGPGGGMGGPGGGGMGGGGMGGGGRGGMGRGSEDGMGGGPTARSMPKAIVRWESAAPVLAATKQQLPPEAAGHYVISVSGLPAWQGGDNAQQGDRTQRMQERLRESTSLQAKGRDPMPPDKISRDRGGNLLFFFGKGDNPLSADDKEATFLTRLGPMEIKAKFTLKDMLYQGKLEL